MKLTLRLLSALLAALLLATACISCTPSADNEPDDTPPPDGVDDTEKEDPYMNVPKIDLATLRQTGIDSQRWLSVPLSRVVINPFQFNSHETTTHSQYSDRPTIPLNIGYLDPYATDGTGRWLEDLLTVYEDSNGEGSAELQYEAELWDSGAWTVSGNGHVDFSAEDGELVMTVLPGASEPWQYAAQPISLDLDANPILTITVDSCEGTWALKVCENGKVDEVIVSDTSKTGTYTYDLAAALKRGGKFEGVIKLFSIGYDKELVVSRMDIKTVSGVRVEAADYTTAWTPMALEFDATYPGGLQLSGFDTFADEDTVLRTITAKQSGAYTLVGAIAGKASYADGVITVRCGGYTYAISWDNTAIKPVFYDEITAALANVSGSTSPNGAAFFALCVESANAGDTLTVAVTVKSDATAAKECATDAAAALAAPDAAVTARTTWETYWQKYLQRVPRPERFALEVVDTKSVSPKDIEQMYYIAWIFLGQNTLPENPEIDYPYPQVCCGKPSMWGYGDAKSAYSASWESFFGIQLLGYVLPDVAWSSLEGLMSLVEEDGMLGGESLPSEKAHSAWLLYELTGDKDRLAGMYDAIGRYLDWRIENPRWIYLEHNNVTSADADFVTSALIDIEYMQKISDILGKADQVEVWKQKHAALLKNYYKWNFDEQGNVYQYCDKISFARTSGCAIWTTKGLLIDGLDDQHKTWLMKRLHTEYSRTGSFAGFTGVKYPEVSHTILGLNKVGENTVARTMAEISARDIIRVGMLSENYTNYPDPTPTGVRPAMFGCALMIDSVLMMNGFDYQNARAIDLGGTGSVSNVTIRGEIKSFTLSE